jgi:hypothetical protein
VVKTLKQVKGKIEDLSSLYFKNQGPKLKFNFFYLEFYLLNLMLV